MFLSTFDDLFLSECDRYELKLETAAGPKKKKNEINLNIKQTLMTLQVFLFDSSLDDEARATIASVETNILQ